jgi:hypothetical protein
MEMECLVWVCCVCFNTFLISLIFLYKMGNPQESISAGHQWLRPIILTRDYRELRSRGSRFKATPRQIVLKTPISKNGLEAWLKC